MKFLYSLVLLTAVMAGGVFASGQESPAPQGRTFVTALPVNPVAVSPGRRTPVEFTFRVESGYHINSSQPLVEELIPTQLHFSLPGEMAVGKIQYPAGELMDFPFDPKTKLSVYSGDFVVHGLIVAPTAAALGTYTVHGELRYQACDNNACYPPKKLPFTFDVKISPAAKRIPKARPNAASPHIHN